MHKVNTDSLWKGLAERRAWYEISNVTIILVFFDAEMHKYSVIYD